MLICNCNVVSKLELSSIIKKHRGISLDKIIEVTGATSKCGRCKSLLEKNYKQLIAKYPPSSQLNLKL